MSDLQKILVAYDGSLHSRAALSWAILLGKQVQTELEVVKVFEPISRHYTRGDYDISEKLAEQYAEMEKADRDMLDEVRTICKECSGLKVQTAVLKGHVAAALLDCAGKKGVNLIVAGTKGHGVLGEMLVGSVTSTLVSLAKVPVLVVKSQRAPSSLQKILVAYDGSDFAKAALDLALDLGKVANAAISAVKVSDPLDSVELCSLAETGSAEKVRAKLFELDEKDQRLMAEAKSIAAIKGMTLETELLSGGDIADEIIRHAEKSDVDLIVAGTLGHGLIGELLLGSVTRDLVSVAKIPVLVVKK